MLKSRKREGGPIASEKVGFTCLHARRVTIDVRWPSSRRDFPSAVLSPCKILHSGGKVSPCGSSSPNFHRSLIFDQGDRPIDMDVLNPLYIPPPKVLKSFLPEIYRFYLSDGVSAMCRLQKVIVDPLFNLITPIRKSDRRSAITPFFPMPIFYVFPLYLPIAGFLRPTRGHIRNIFLVLPMGSIAVTYSRICRETTVLSLRVSYTSRQKRGDQS